MPPLLDPVLHGVPLVGLVALLVTAYRHPSGRTEALVGILAAGATVTSGLLTGGQVADVLRHLGPVMAFLATILVVADICAQAGVFTAAARRVVALSGGRPAWLLTGVFLLAAAVTTVLSLDATVVLLVPVVVGAAIALGVPTRPGAQACLRMANSASLLLPVSNLTNLLALHHVDLTFTGFALVMAPVLTAVLVVEYAALRLLHRRDLAVPARAPTAAPIASSTPTMPPLPRVPVTVLGLMLVGFAVTSPFGLDPFWVSAAAAVVLVGWARRRQLSTVRGVLHAAHPGFAVFVLCLGVVVAALATGPLGQEVAALVPDTTSWAALLWIATLATALANLLTNLSATLLLVPLVAPLGTEAVLAALVGLNVGSGLTLSGSLANLLWRRTLRRQGVEVGLRDFHRLSLVATPLAVLAGVTALTLVG